MNKNLKIISQYFGVNIQNEVLNESHFFFTQNKENTLHAQENSKRLRAEKRTITWMRRTEDQQFPL